MEVYNGVFLPRIDTIKCNNERGCHRCYDVCPGLGVDLNGYANKLYCDDCVRNNKYIGRYVQCYTGHSNDEDLRYHSASGGMVSQFLIWLLNNNHIDGAVVTRFDKESPLKVRTYIATTKEEVLAAKSSKYSPVSFHDVAKEIKAAEGKRYVVVGLPCHIEGMRKLMDKDQKLKEKIIGLFAIYCSGTRTFNFTEYLFKSRGIDVNKVEYLAYRDNGCLGGMVVKGLNIDYYEDYQRYAHPLRTIFFPRRCLLCADHFGELADICFGDIHVKPFSDDKIGINSMVVRNTFWNDLLQKAYKSGVISLQILDKDVLLSSQKMAKIKKHRNMSYCLLNKKFNCIVPEYGNFYDGSLSVRNLINYVRMGVERYIGKHRALWMIIPLIKSKVNLY
jgi:coenzyme F420 hydrogenase subunit beta